jgi:hypothetical protein
LNTPPLRAAAVLAAVIATAGCAATEAQPAVPARLAPPASPACLAQAEAFAAEQTGQRVTLGPTAFSTGDELVLERSMPRDAQGRPLDGRQLPKPPQVFKLSQRGSVCLMSHPPSGRSVELKACACVPL